MRFWVINGLCWLVIMILCTHSHLRIAGANSRKLDFGFGNSQKCTEMNEKNSPEREIWWFWWGNWVDNGAGLEEKKALSIYQRGAKMNGKSGLKSWKNKSIWKQTKWILPCRDELKWKTIKVGKESRRVPPSLGTQKKTTFCIVWNLDGLNVNVMKKHFILGREAGPSIAARIDGGKRLRIEGIWGIRKEPRKGTGTEHE